MQPVKVPSCAGRSGLNPAESFAPCQRETNHWRGPVVQTITYATMMVSDYLAIIASCFSMHFIQYYTLHVIAIRQSSHRSCRVGATARYLRRAK